MTTPVHDTLTPTPDTMPDGVKQPAPVRKVIHFTAIVLMVAAVFQIIGAAAPEVLKLGVSVSQRSFETQHPLVPEGIAFSIWGLIYLWGLAAAIWAMRSGNTHVSRFRFPLLCLSLIFVLNGVWALWVPFRGFDTTSILIIAVSVATGIAGLVQLKGQAKTIQDMLFVVLPLSLVTGWVSAALTVNITSALVESGFAAFDPRVPMNSGLALVVLLAFVMTVIWLTRNRFYALPVIWALFWIISAAVNRDQLPLMATLAGMGIGIILVELVALSLIRRQPKGPASKVEARPSDTPLLDG
ncbi:MAG: hypothetical protein QM645_07895 [Asticcacaulis sp.]